MVVLWSRGGSNDYTTRKWMIRNILKENSTYINDSWEKPLLSLTQSWILTSVLGDGPAKLRRRELSRYMSHEGEFICRGNTPTGIHATLANFPFSIGEWNFCYWRLSYFLSYWPYFYHDKKKKKKKTEGEKQKKKWSSKEQK